METDNKSKNSLFANIPNDLSAEVFEDIVKSDNVRIERIISNGQTSPEHGWYNQDQNEWVIVIKGRAQLIFENPLDNSVDSPVNHSDKNQTVVDLNVGDYINIPSHTKHKVSYTDTTQPTIWLAVFY